MLLLTVTNWLDRREREMHVYLIEENRVLRRQIGRRRLRLTDEDRRKLRGHKHASVVFVGAHVSVGCSTTTLEQRDDSVHGVRRKEGTLRGSHLRGSRAAVQQVGADKSSKQ